MKNLFSPFSSPWIETKNRFVMSAMTRGFAPERMCTQTIAEYYAKRAEAGVGLILTEGIVVHSSGNGYRDVPFIETDEQAVSWKYCIERVHKAGSLIFSQLWHCGRISHSDFTGGADPVSSCSEQAEGINRQNGKPFGTPRMLRSEEIPGVIKLFVDAAKRAVNVGFDGVELHLGHGYLVDQFLDARINKRNDTYGGSIENRARLAVELVEAVVGAVGASKVMVRISPSRDMGGVYDWPDLEPLLAHLLGSLDRLGVRLLDISCANANYFATSGRVIRMARSLWPYVILGGASLSPSEAEAELEKNFLDLVTWGRAMIANPDIVAKVKNGISLVEFDNSMRSTLI